jgi:chromate transporter
MKFSLLNIFFIFLKLGFISFGGPVAHLSFFYRDLVVRRQLIDEKTYIDLVALCQSLPGPASSQVAISIGMKQQGLLGGIAAILGFLLPSVVIMILAGYALNFFAVQSQSLWLHGFKIAVAAVIAQAILQMGQRFFTGITHILIAVTAAIVATVFVSFVGQIGAILIGAIVGKLLIQQPDISELPRSNPDKGIISTRTAITAWILFFVLLFGLPFINAGLNNHALSLFNSFYRTGALVFGGGHVILPLLESQVVMSGWVDNNTFLTGYGIAQAVPGPLFSFAGFLGTVTKGVPHGWLGGLFCVFAIYLPSILILVGIMPIWEKWRQHQAFQSILAGVSAAVVGLLIAAFYDPIWVATIQSSTDLIIAIAAFLFLQLLRWPQWLIVLLCVLSELLIQYI